MNPTGAWRPEDFRHHPQRMLVSRLLRCVSLGCPDVELRRGIPIITTQDGAYATVHAIEVVKETDWDVTALQDYHA